jgi:hypothetical protein
MYMYIYIYIQRRARRQQQGEKGGDAQQGQDRAPRAGSAGFGRRLAFEARLGWDLVFAG